MSLLKLEPSRCVRGYSVHSICTKCADICPTNAIAINDRLPSINQSLCVGCAGCVSACPTEALQLNDYNPTNSFFDYLNEADSIYSCQKNIPCILALSAEHLISLTALKKSLIIDIGHCNKCEIGESALQSFKKTVDEALYALEAMESDGVIELKELYISTDDEDIKDRRDFFKTFHLNKIAKIRSDFDDEVTSQMDEFVDTDISEINPIDVRTKKITDRRKIFFTAMKKLEKPSFYHVIDANMVSFTSQKLLDEAKCSACSMCYRVCPTAALSSDVRNSKIDFDPFLCVKCHLCHDVCEVDAITLSSSYNIKEWFEPTVQNLATFRVRSCDECGLLFSSVMGEKICRRCALEEEEAMELWGLN